MMSEHQPRKTRVMRDPIQQPLATNFVQPDRDDAVHGKTPKPKSKNTIPKSLRYDLENALIGLCDVWFEEMKPYLERNNIKVHVHEPTAVNGQGDSSERCTHGAPDCAHLHPASSATRCELCRLLFNAANSIESAVSQAACGPGSLCAGPSAASAVSPDETPSTERYTSHHAAEPHCMACPRFLDDAAATPQRPSQCHKSNEEMDLRTVKHTRKNKSKAPQLRHPVPRFCHTYSVPAETFRQHRMGSYRRHSPFVSPTSKRQSPQKNSMQIEPTKNKPEMTDAWTQTETLLKINTVFPIPRKSLKSGRSGRPRNFDRFCATAAFLPSKNKNTAIIEPNNRVQDIEVPPLFKNDLIDIIGEKHDKMLRVLYKSPDRDMSTHSSSLNLFSSSKPGKKSASHKTLARPWR